MSGIRSPFPQEQATKPALLLVTHGVEGGPGVAARHAARLQTLWPQVTIQAACLRGRPVLEEALASLSPRPVIVLPLLMADGYILDWLNQRLASVGGRIRALPPVGAELGIAAILRQMAREAIAATGWPAAATTLLLVGHGTPRHPQSGRTLAMQAARLQTRGDFPTVATAFLEQEPKFAVRVREYAGVPLVVLGFFADAGPHGCDDVQRVLADLPTAYYAGVVGERVELVFVLARMAAVVLQMPEVDVAGGPSTFAHTAKGQLGMGSRRRCRLEA